MHTYAHTHFYRTRSRELMLLKEKKHRGSRITKRQGTKLHTESVPFGFTQLVTRNIQKNCSLSFPELKAKRKAESFTRFNGPKIRHYFNDAICSHHLLGTYISQLILPPKPDRKVNALAPRSTGSKWEGRGQKSRLLDF